MINWLICQRNDNKQFVTIRTKKGYQDQLFAAQYWHRCLWSSTFPYNHGLQKEEEKAICWRKIQFLSDLSNTYFHISELIWFASHYKLQNSVSDIYFIHQSKHGFLFCHFFWNFMKIYLQQEHLATNLNFPLIKLEKFVHSHLNLFICLSLHFFPNQTFLL